MKTAKYIKILLFISLFTLLRGNILLAQSLNDYLATASENNSSLKAAYQEYLAALEKTPQVGALEDPRLSFGYFINPLMTRGGDQIARIGIEQMLPWFGTLDTRKDAAAQQARMKLEEVLQMRNELYFEVKEVYFELYNIRQDILLTQQSIDILETYEQLATQKYENAEADMVDILRVQMQIREMRTTLFALQEDLDALQVKFNTLLNKEANEAVEVEEVLPATAAILNTDSLRAQVLENNPSLRILREEGSLLQQEARLAGLSNRPEVSVGLEYGIMQASPDLEMPNNGMDMLMPMVSLNLPIFSKKYAAERQEVKLMQEGNAFFLQDEQNSLLATVEETLTNYEVALSRMQLYEEQIKATEQAISILNSAYETASEDFEEVLEFQMQLLDYQMKLNEAQTNARIAQAKIEELTAVEVMDVNEE
ncbi:MAG: TolC family protein [Cyclobacteriaceae bacterium]